MPIRANNRVVYIHHTATGRNNHPASDIRPPTIHHLYITLLAFIHVLLFIPLPSPGQSSDESIRSLVEARYPDGSAEEAEAYGEALRWLAENPVNVNRSPAYRLARLPGLDAARAQRIVGWREEHPPFAELGELVGVPGIGSGTVERIRPFATVGDPRRIRRQLRRDSRYWLKEGRFTLYSRVRMQREKRAGFRRADESGYRGDRIQHYQRMRYRTAHLDLNLTQQKDAGEAWSRSARQDHAVGYASIHEVGRLRRLVAGNFEMAAGEGLLFGGGSLLGKGRNVLSAPVQRGGGGLKPFGSSRESGYFRGLGASFQLGARRRTTLTLWGSRRKLDARTLSGDTVRYSTETGYHRTATEYAKTGRLGRQSAGGSLEWRHDHGIVGFAGYHAAYDRPVVARLEGEQASLISPRQHGGSLYHQSTFGHWQLYGEAAANQQGKAGLLQGVHHTLTDRTGWVAAYRHYQPGHYSIFGSGFGESPGDAERGVYLGMNHLITENLHIGGYLDQYRFGRPRYGDSRPSRGFDWLLTAGLDAGSDWSGYLQLKGDRRQVEVESAGGRTPAVRRKLFRPRHSLRLHLERQVGRSFRLRFRIDATRTHPPEEKLQHGVLFYQDLRWRPLPWLQVDGRFTLFDTDDYDSRVYQFENDLLYVMSNKMLHGSGRRSYVLLNLKPLPQLECRIKYGITRYDHQKSVGSGLGKIEGNRQSKIGFQMRWRW